jgi:hypothetical protein
MLCIKSDHDLYWSRKTLRRHRRFCSAYPYCVKSTHIRYPFPLRVKHCGVAFTRDEKDSKSEPKKRDRPASATSTPQIEPAGQPRGFVWSLGWARNSAGPLSSLANREPDPVRDGLRSRSHRSGLEGSGGLVIWRGASSQVVTKPLGTPAETGTTRGLTRWAATRVARETDVPTHPWPDWQAPRPGESRKMRYNFWVLPGRLRDVASS